jgi:hypothetical protein
MAIVNRGWAFVSGSDVTAASGEDKDIQFNNVGFLSGNILLTTDGSGSLSASVHVSASTFYGDGSNLTGVTASAVAVADGPEMSVQFRYDSPIGREISGSSDLMWLTGSSPFLQVTGAVKISGPQRFAPRLCVTGAAEILASGGGGLHISGSASGSLLDIVSDAVGDATKSILFVSGSGDIGIGTLLPNHTLTISGSVSASSDMSASAFYGMALSASGDTYVGNNLFVSNNTSQLWGGLDLNSVGITATGPIADATTVSGTYAQFTAVTGSTLTASGDTYVGNNLFVSNNTSQLWGGLDLNSVGISATGPIADATTVSGTYAQFTAVTASAIVGGSPLLISSSATISLSASAITLGTSCSDVVTVNAQLTASCGIDPQGAGANSIQVGDAFAAGVTSIAIGEAAATQGTDEIVIGHAAAHTATGGSTILIGGTAAAVGSNGSTAGIAIGQGATLNTNPGTTNFSIALGAQATASYSSAIAVGFRASASAGNAIAIGSGSNNPTANSMTIGSSTQGMDFNVTGNITLLNNGDAGYGHLNVCQGTASILHLSGCSPIQVHAPMSSSYNISASAFYGDGSSLTGITASAVNVADGPEQAIQFRVDTPVSGEISGSSALMFLTASNTLSGTYAQFTAVTGSTLTASGDAYVGGKLYAYNNSAELWGGLDLNSVGITATGPIADATTVSGTYAQFTAVTASNIVGGSPITISASAITLSGDITTDYALSSSQNISASAFYGDGSNLTNVGGGGHAWTGSTANGVVTYLNATTASVQSQLTFATNILSTPHIQFNTDGATILNAYGSPALTFTGSGGNARTTIGGLITASVMQLSGNLNAAADQAKSIFSQVTSNNITVGGDGSTLSASNVDIARALSASALVGTGLTATRVVLAGTDGVLEDASNLTFATNILSTPHIQFNTDGATILNAYGSPALTFSGSGGAAKTTVGHLLAAGNISASSNISASAFYGDGANLTNLPPAPPPIPAGSDTNIQFNQNGSFAGTAGLVFDGSGSLTVSGSYGVSEYIDPGFGLEVTKSLGGKLTLGAWGNPYLQTLQYYATSSAGEPAEDEITIGPFNRLQIYQDGQISLSSSANADPDFEMPAGIELICNPGNGVVSIDTNRVSFVHNTASLSSEEQEYLWSINSDHAGDEDDSAWIKLDVDGKEFAVGAADSIKLVALGGLQVDNAASTFNSAATFNSSLVANGNVTLGDASGDGVTWNAGSWDMSANSVITTLKDGVDGLNGGNGALMFFTGSGGDFMKFHTSGSAKGIVFPQETYLSRAGALSGTVAGPGSFLAIDSDNKVVLATPAGGGGSIFTEINGTQAATTSSVSIGSSGTPAATLHVSSSGDAALFRVDGLTETAPPLFVTGSGRVGIGTQAPGATLDVLGDTLSDQLRLGHGGAFWYKMGRGGDGFLDFQGTQTNHTGYTFKNSSGTGVVRIEAENSRLAVTGSVLPGADNTHDLGSADKRWANVYTGDLHLANDRGDWTVVEEEDYLTIKNNKTGKRFKLLMEEIE